MPRSPQVAAFLRRLRKAVDDGQLKISDKAEEEAGEIGWFVEDVLAEVLALRAADFLRTEEPLRLGSWHIYVFCPSYWDGGHLWIRLAESIGTKIIVVSFHRTEGDPWKI